LDFDEFEVVVISDGSTDGTNEFLEGLSTPYSLVFEARANGGPAAARNRGVEIARAPIILFLDDDMVATPALLSRHLQRHRESEGPLAVIGPMLTPTDAVLSMPIRWEQAMLYKQYDALVRGDYPPTYRQFFTGNASIPRVSVLSVGGFDLRFRRNEDVELAYRMKLGGVRFVFDPEAIGYHYAERAFGRWLLNAHDYGVNDVMFARDHPEEGLLERTRREYAGRHWLVRWTTRASVARPWFERTCERVLRGAAAAAGTVRASRLTQASLSGLYNLAYYCGMAAELGGPAEFYANVERVSE
jgi:GT2 family glycosyltransferase